MGDVERNPDTQAPAAPPSLRNPGETLPGDNSKDSRVGVMKPVQFPKQKPDDAARRQSRRAAGRAAVRARQPPADSQPSASAQLRTGRCIAACRGEACSRDGEPAAN